MCCYDDVWVKVEVLDEFPGATLHFSDNDALWKATLQCLMLVGEPVSFRGFRRWFCVTFFFTVYDNHRRRTLTRLMLNVSTVVAGPRVVSCFVLFRSSSLIIITSSDHQCVVHKSDNTIQYNNDISLTPYVIEKMSSTPTGHE